MPDLVNEHAFDAAMRRKHYGQRLGAAQDAYEDFTAAKKSARGDMDALPLLRGTLPAAAQPPAASTAAAVTGPLQPTLGGARRQPGAASSGDGVVSGGYAAGQHDWRAGTDGHAGVLSGPSVSMNGSAVAQNGAGLNGYSAGANGRSAGAGSSGDGTAQSGFGIASYGSGAAAGGSIGAQQPLWPAALPPLPPLLPLPAPALGLMSAMLPGGAQALDSSARMWAAAPWGLALNPYPNADPADANGAQPSAREALRFILSPDGAFFREFLTNEIVVSMDALSRAGAQLSGRLSYVMDATRALALYAMLLGSQRLAHPGFGQARGLGKP